MPIHEFVCDKCSVRIEDSNTKDIHFCPMCGKGMRWDCRVAIHGNYKHPVHSDALAVPEHQRAEHERLFPNIELDGDCRPVFDNFTDHEAYLKKTNMIKQPQKIRAKSKKATVG